MCRQSPNTRRAERPYSSANAAESPRAALAARLCSLSSAMPSGPVLTEALRSIGLKITGKTSQVGRGPVHSALTAIIARRMVDFLMWIDPIIRFLIFPVSGWLFASGCDELLVAGWFACRTAFGRDSWDISLDKLDRLPEKRLAMFIPCWQEGDVIEQMVDHNIAGIDYHNYDIFLGVYPNDTATIEKAGRLMERYPRVHRAICPQPGPLPELDLPANAPGGRYSRPPLRSGGPARRRGPGASQVLPAHQSSGVV